MLKEIPQNQTNLIDAIKVEDHIVAVKKSIGEQKPLFEIEEPKPINTEVKTEPEEEITIEPTAGSINDQFSINAEQPTLADKLGQQPIKDLTNSIGLNQKFLFMNDLFEGENDKYKEAIETINKFSTLVEADSYINNSLKGQYNWDMNAISTQKFISLVQRRFL